jgi:dCMP deaminase
MTWDEYFLLLATTASLKSKDPSTQVGAAIARPDNTIVTLGYNGFPRGVADTPERLNDRPTKYSLVVHAEVNAILSARESLNGYTMYCTLMPCDRCFVQMIQCGIKRVVFPQPTAEQYERWGDSFQRVYLLARETGIELVEAYLENNDLQLRKLS